MDDLPRIPNLTDIEILPRWAKVLFLSRCAARVIPLIQSHWSSLTAIDMVSIGMAGGNAGASAHLGREVMVGADPLPRLMHLIQTAEKQGNMAGYSLAVCACAAGLSQVEDSEKSTSIVGQTMETLIQAYAASGLSESTVIGSVWFDYVALRNASQAGNWVDETPIAQDVLGDLWPHGTPPNWPLS